MSNDTKNLADEIDALLTGTFPFPWTVNEGDVGDEEFFYVPTSVESSDKRDVVAYEGGLSSVQHPWHRDELRANGKYIVGAEPLLRRAAAALRSQAQADGEGYHVCAGPAYPACATCGAPISDPGEAPSVAYHCGDPKPHAAHDYRPLVQQRGQCVGTAEAT